MAVEKGEGWDPQEPKIADRHKYLSNSHWGDHGMLTNQSGSDLIDHQSSRAGIETPRSLNVSLSEAPPL